MKLTIDLGYDQIDVDLGEPSSDGDIGFFDNGDLHHYNGNVYLHIDGQEYGSLFIYAVGGRPRIELGQFLPEAQQWESVNPLISTYNELTAAYEAEQEAGR